jgi:hypothetical protein
LEVPKTYRNFASRIRRKGDMETKSLQFCHPVGTFRDSVRAYRKYKEEWRAKMEVKLAKMEEEIQQAKADPFYKVDAV